jgi:hypothetical protein
MNVYAHYFRIILIGSALISTLSLLSFGAGQRTAVQELTKAIKAHTISPADARKKALSFKLTGTELTDHIVRELVNVADSNGIQDILNPTKLISAPAKPSPAVKPIEPTKPAKPDEALRRQVKPTEPSKPSKIIESLQATPKVTQPSAPIATQKPELLVPARLPDATFNALKEKLKILKKNHTTMSPQEIEQKIDEIKKGFNKVPIPKEMTTILTKIEAFKKQLAEDIAAITNLSIQFMEKELKNKLTDPKVIKKLPEAVEMAQEEINRKRARYILNKSMQITASNVWRALQNALYKVLRESMKQAVQLSDNDNALLGKLIKKYFVVVHRHPFHSEKHLDKLLQKRQEDELKIELENIAKLAKIAKEKQKGAIIQKQIEEEEQRLTKELDALLAIHSKTLQGEEQNATILNNLITDDRYMMLQPDEAERQLNLLEGNLTTAQYERYEKINDYLDSIYDDIVITFVAENTISAAEGLIAHKHLDAHKAGEMLITLEEQLDTCRERLKAARPHSWLAQQFTAKIKEFESIAETVKDIWYEFEMTSSQQQALEDQTLDALTQAAQPPAPSAVMSDVALAKSEALAKVDPTPAPSTPSKESEFDAAVKKAEALIKDPTTAEELGAQAKELDKLYDYYKSQNMQNKSTEIEKLIKQLDKIAEKLDEDERGIKKPTEVEFNTAIKNTIELTLEQPSIKNQEQKQLVIDRWRTQHEELSKFSTFYEQELKREQELKAANKAYNQNKIDQAQKKLNELGPYIEVLSDKIVELEGSSEIIATPALKNLTKVEGL